MRKLSVKTIFMGVFRTHLTWSRRKTYLRFSSSDSNSYFLRLVLPTSYERSTDSNWMSRWLTNLFQNFFINFRAFYLRVFFKKTSPA